jgi:hypothetical protein
MRYVVEIDVPGEMSDWELDELNQLVVDWLSVDYDDQLSVTTKEVDDE